VADLEAQVQAAEVALSAKLVALSNARREAAELAETSTAPLEDEYLWKRAALDVLARTRPPLPADSDPAAERLEFGGEGTLSDLEVRAAVLSDSLQARRAALEAEREALDAEMMALLASTGGVTAESLAERAQSEVEARREEAVFQPLRASVAAVQTENRRLHDRLHTLEQQRPADGGGAGEAGEGDMALDRRFYVETVSEMISKCRKQRTEAGKIARTMVRMESELAGAMGALARAAKAVNDAMEDAATSFAPPLSSNRTPREQQREPQKEPSTSTDAAVAGWARECLRRSLDLQMALQTLSQLMATASALENETRDLTVSLRQDRLALEAFPTGSLTQMRDDLVAIRAENDVLAARVAGATA
jgi:hypothetical protein